MTMGHDGVTELMNNIKIEIEHQLSKSDREINTGKLIELSTLMPNKLMVSDLIPDTKDALQKFANSLYINASVRENLEDRLNDAKRFLNVLSKRQ